MPQTWDPNRGEPRPPKLQADPEPPVVPPVNLTRPVLQGPALRGGTFTAQAGTWSSLEPVTRSWQLYRCDYRGGSQEAIGSPVTSIGAVSRVTTSDDDDHCLILEETATNSAGSVSVFSPISGRIFAAPMVGVHGQNEAQITGTGQTNGDTKGRITGCGTTSNSTTVQLDTNTSALLMYSFHPGDKVNIGTQSNPTVRANQREIVSVDRDAKTITLDGAAISTTTADSVFRPGYNFTLYPGYGSPAGQYKAEHERWLGYPHARVNIHRQKFESGSQGGAGDVQWDLTAPSQIISEQLDRLACWKYRTGPFAEGEPIDPTDLSKGTWEADPAGTVRRLSITVSPGFVREPGITAAATAGNVLAVNNSGLDNPLQDGQSVQWVQTNAVTGLTNNASYYVQNATDTGLQLSTDEAGVNIVSFGGSGNGRLFRNFWFRQLSGFGTDAHNSASKLQTYQCWNWIAYGAPDATSGAMEDGGDGVFVDGVLDTEATATNQPYNCWTGTVDNFARQMCRALHAKGLSDSIITLWHEAAGGWYAWAWNNPAFIDAWRRFVAIYRDEENELGVAPEDSAQFGWPFEGTIPNNYTFFARDYTTGSIIQAPSRYPGDDWVDVLVPDFYGDVDDDGAYALSRMDEQRTFSVAHGGRWITNSEWGFKLNNTTAGTPNSWNTPRADGQYAALDDEVATFVTAMADKMETIGAAFGCYFDVIVGGNTQAAGRENYRLSPSTPPGVATSYPQAALKYIEAWGVPATVDPEDPDPEPDPTPPTPTNGRTFVVHCQDTSAAPLKGFEKYHNHIQSNASAGGTMRDGDRAAIAALGVTMERLFMRGNAYCTGQGTWNFTTHTGQPTYNFTGGTSDQRFNALDSMMADLVARGIEPVICHYNLPTWLSGNSHVDTVPTDHLAYKKMLKDCIVHLKQQNNAWKYLESYNEPDQITRTTGASGFSKAQSWQYWDTYYDAVEEVNAAIVAGSVSGVPANSPPIQLIGPTLKAPDLQWMESFFDYCVQVGKLPKVITYHQYEGTEYATTPDGLMLSFYTAAVNIQNLTRQAFSVSVPNSGSAWALTVNGVNLTGLSRSITAASLGAALQTALGVQEAPKVSMQPAGGSNHYHVTFGNQASNLAVTASSPTSGVTVNVTSGFGGQLDDIDMWVTEYDGAKLFGADMSAAVVGTNSTKPSGLTSPNSAYCATWFLGAASWMAKGGVSKAFKFDQAAYNNYLYSILVPTRLSTSQWSPAGAFDGAYYPVYNAMKMLTMMPGSAVGIEPVGSAVQPTATGHGFGCFASVATTGGVGNHGQVGVLIWYNRQSGQAQPNVSPTLQLNNLPAGLRGRALKITRYMVDEKWSNWEGQQSTYTLQQAGVVTASLGPYDPEAHAVGIDPKVTWNLDTTSPTNPGTLAVNTQIDGYGQYKAVLFIIEAASA